MKSRVKMSSKVQEWKGKKIHNSIITLLTGLYFHIYSSFCVLGFLRVTEGGFNVPVPNDGPVRHSAAGLWGAERRLWMLFGNLVGESGTGWQHWQCLGAGRVPSWLCGETSGHQRVYCVRAEGVLWHQRVRPSLSGSAGILANVGDFRPEESPDSWLRLLGHLQKWTANEQKKLDRTFVSIHFQIYSECRPPWKALEGTE